MVIVIIWGFFGHRWVGSIGVFGVDGLGFFGRERGEGCFMYSGERTSIPCILCTVISVGGL